MGTAGSHELRSSGALGENQVAEQGHQKLAYCHLLILPSLRWFRPKSGSPHGYKVAASKQLLGAPLPLADIEQENRACSLQHKDTLTGKVKRRKRKRHRAL